MPTKNNCCYGSNNPTSKLGQYRYELLSTSLVSDQAIARGIVTHKNVTLVLFFFINAGQNPILGPWLMPTPAVLKESRWLQVVNWLMGQYVLLEAKKSRVTDFLVDMGEVECSDNSRSMQVIMCKPLPLDIERELAKEYKNCSNLFC